MNTKKSLALEKIINIERGVRKNLDKRMVLKINLAISFISVGRVVMTMARINGT